MPSKSSLDRLPKQLSECWEAECTRFEAMLRAQETVPLKAVTVAVSLDGVMVPMKYGGRARNAMRLRPKVSTPAAPRAIRKWGAAQ